MLIENASGNYAFVRGIGPFSSAVIARPGFEIVHAAFRPSVALADGYSHIERHLKKLRRPINALCGMELRIPKVLTREGFEEFNKPYVERLRGWGVEVNGANPVTRTNVAVEVDAVAEPAIAGFFYAIPSEERVLTWVLSGAAEIASRDGGVQIVARGDTSQEGLRQKAECVLNVLTAHLSEMGASWKQATTINLYTVHDVHPILASTLIPGLHGGSRYGLTWHFARPPVAGLDLEIDAHAVRTALTLT